jgi:hypothetical protein
VAQCDGQSEDEESVESEHTGEDIVDTRDVNTTHAGAKLLEEASVNTFEISRTTFREKEAADRADAIPFEQLPYPSENPELFSHLNANVGSEYADREPFVGIQSRT